MKSCIRKMFILVNAMFNLIGLRIVKKGPRADIRHTCKHFQQLGFNPQTIIDVGVADGTYDIYNTWPDAAFLLIEPLEEFKLDLEKIKQKYNNVYYEIAAANDNNGKITINVHDVLTGSSILKQREGSHADGIEREVSAVTIDELCRNKNLSGPFLIKADVQGAELTVMEGAKQTLINSEVVILEVGLFESLYNRPELYDVVNYMKSHKFVVYDIIGLSYRPYDNALNHVDLVFVKELGQFRKHKAYR